jgi:hypothetical protein
MQSDDGQYVSLTFMETGLYVQTTLMLLNSLSLGPRWSSTIIFSLVLTTRLAAKGTDSGHGGQEVYYYLILDVVGKISDSKSKFFYVLNMKLLALLKYFLTFDLYRSVASNRTLKSECIHESDWLQNRCDSICMYKFLNLTVYSLKETWIQVQGKAFIFS